jgi:hypothetical protein
LTIENDKYETIAADQDLLKHKITDLRQHSVRPLGKLHVKNFLHQHVQLMILELILKKQKKF